jgi:glycosyltransferase involved in cell wall biosynthesis
MNQKSSLSPRVSVGLPVHNGGHYLRLAIEAILNQTFTDYELVISDNCSMDDTQLVCKEFAGSDARIRYMRQPRNLGAAPNHNLLVDHASGEYFMWVMHDDLYAPTAIERCVEALDHNANAVVAYPRMVTIDCDGQQIRSVEVGAHSMENSPHRCFARCVSTGNSVHCRQGIIRVEALRRTMLNLPFRYSDHPLVAELALLGKIYEVPENLYFKRVHSGSSLNANTDPRILSQWFDTSSVSTGRGYLLSVYGAFVNAVLRHRELGLSEQLLCLLALQQWPVAQLRNWAGLRRRTLLQWFRRGQR